MNEATCAPGCTYSLLNNNVCDEVCDNSSCNYDNEACLCNTGCYNSYIKDGICEDVCNCSQCGFDGGDCQGSSSGYVNLLTIIGFIVISISFCFIFLVMVWYYKRRHQNFVRISGSEESRRQTIGEINDRFPEMACPSNETGEICAICLDE